MEMSQLRIGVFCGRDFAAMDYTLFGRNSKACDPYVVVNFGTQTIQTRVVANTVNPGKTSFDQNSSKCCISQWQNLYLCLNCISKSKMKILSLMKLWGVSDSRLPK